MQADQKRVEMKLRKMKERRNFYRSEKDQQKLKVNEMQKDNEALFQQVQKMQEQSHSHREENSKLVQKLKNTEKQLEMVSKDLNQAQEHSQSIAGKNEQVEKEFSSHINWQESKISDLTGQLKFESDQRNKMAEEIVRLEKLVKSREDYMVSLENESIYLRKEIKNSKFVNEKQGYLGFVGNLTQLRASRERSHNRVEQQHASIENRIVNLSNQNAFVPVKQERGYDDQPSRDIAAVKNNNQGQRQQNNQVRTETAEPPNQLFSQRKDENSLDARSRLMMSDLSKEPSRKQSPFQGINSLRKLSNNGSKVTSPIMQAKPSSTKQQNPPQSLYEQQPAAACREEFSASRERTPQQTQHHQIYDDINKQETKIENQRINTISSHMSEQIDEKTIDQKDQSHIQVISQSYTVADQSTAINDKSQTDTVLAVTPLEQQDYHINEQNKSSVLVTEPTVLDVTNEMSLQQSRPEKDLTASRIDEQQQLADNSMVLQQHMSEMAQRQRNIVAEAERNCQPAVVSSSFTDQSKRTAEAAQSQHVEPTSQQRVSTMIPLGAPKGDGDLRDKYKQMLMAKLDMKTISRRKRQEQSSEP